jgi:putative ABC transport system ATP-binding protein
MTHAALEVKDLVKTFALDGTTINAVDHVSFEVNSGEFVALVGPSGSGKTTMLSIMAALLSPTSGQVLVDGLDLAEMSEKQRVRLRREKIGFTFQSNNLIPFLTSQENVEFMLRLNNKADKAGRLRSAELLARLGLSDRLHNLPAQLSGGQQQRVAIADSLPGHGTRLPGGGDVCPPDPRKQPRRHHGHTRPAHVPVRGSRLTDAGWQTGASL